MKYYTPEEDDLIREAARKQWTVNRLAEALGRSKGSVQNRLVRLGLRMTDFKPGGRPPKLKEYPIIKLKGKEKQAAIDALYLPHGGEFAYRVNQ